MALYDIHCTIYAWPNQLKWITLIKLHMTLKNYVVNLSVNSDILWPLLIVIFQRNVPNA